MNESTIEQVREYYGKILKTNDDLKTSACCTADSLPRYLRPLMSDIHPEVTKRFYGCGSPIPLELTGRTVLDLGCGSGTDCFLLSKLVGQDGRVIGVDMTDEQLEVARRHVAFHTEKYGYAKSNVEFHKGYIEDLESNSIATNSVDVVISNCVINLSPDKRRVFSETFRVLKPGGELYFSDVFCSERVPQALKTDSVLLGECLGGALYIEDFRRLLLDLGVRDYRIVAKSPIVLSDNDVIKKAGMLNFSSLTIRAFKIEALEDRCEDYGQVAVYRGTLNESPHAFVLDDHHTFKKGKAFPVCSNTAFMLSQTRYARHFEINGDLTTHYGLFDCSNPTINQGDTSSVACC